MTSKGDTIAAIMKLNRSAPAEFLSEFSNKDLHEYLRRLADLRSRRRSSDRSAPPAALAFAAPGGLLDGL